LVGSYFFNPLAAASWLVTSFYLVIFAILLVIFVYDFKYMEIPMLVLWLGVGVSLLYLILADYQSFASVKNFLDLKIVSGLLSGLVAGGFFYGLAAYSKETWMGYGDAYLGLLTGLVVGWPNILPTLLISFVLGALISIGLVAMKTKSLKSQVPFAPFLIGGVFLTIFLPKMFPQLELYFSFFL